MGMKMGMEMVREMGGIGEVGEGGVGRWGGGGGEGGGGWVGRACGVGFGCRRRKQAEGSEEGGGARQGRPGSAGSAGRRVGGSVVSAWTVYSAFVVRGSKGRLSGESAAYVWRNPLVGYGVD